MSSFELIVWRETETGMETEREWEKTAINNLYRPLLCSMSIHLSSNHLFIRFWYCVYGPCCDFFFFILNELVLSWSIEIDPNEFIAFFMHIFLVLVVISIECVLFVFVVFFHWIDLRIVKEKCSTMGCMTICRNQTIFIQQTHRI